MSGPSSQNSKQDEGTEVRRWGSVQSSNFEIKDYVALGEGCGGLDYCALAKISGPRFVLLRGPMARLHRVLGQFMLDLFTSEHGYLEHYLPGLVQAAALESTGQLPSLDEDLFKCIGQDSVDLYLTPSAEVSLISLEAGQSLLSAQLPLKMVALSTCFHSEAGAAGPDTLVTARQRQYDEVGMVQMIAPSDHDAALESLTSHVEHMLRLLGIPYRVIARCASGQGSGMGNTYELEVWMPSQGNYRTISSCKGAADCQDRRIQAGRVGADNGQITLALMVSCSLAVNRLLFAVLENCQQADGSILMPEVVRPYLNGVVTMGG